MPNWCVGDLRIRGSRENIKRFLLDGLKPVSAYGEDAEALEYNDETDYDLLQVIVKGGTSLYICGTQRGFVEEEFYVDFESDSDSKIACIPNVKFAWEIDVGGLSAISKKYDVDFRMYGFECGMEFNQDVKIVNGVVIKNIQTNIADYRWECICPSKGG